MLATHLRAIASRSTLRNLLYLTVAVLVLSQAAPAETPAKRPLTHNDYDSWRSIQGTQLSPDGRFLAYFLSPQDGDGEMVVRNLDTGKEWRQPRGRQGGAGAPVAKGKARAELPGAAAGGPVFTADGRAILFLISPTRAETEKARKAKVRPEEMPRTRLGILNLATCELTTVDRVRAFQMAEESSSYVIYQRESLTAPAQSETPDTTQRTPAFTGGKTKIGGKGTGTGKGTAGAPLRRQFGTDLVIRSLLDQSERTLSDVLEFSLTKDGQTLVYTVGSRQEANNGVYVLTPGSSGPPITLLAGRGRYSRMTWDEKQTQLAFLSDRDDAAATQPKLKVYCWQRQPAISRWQTGVGIPALGWAAFTGADLMNWAMPTLRSWQTFRAVELVSTATPNFRPGMVISDRGALSFARDGSKLFLSVAPPQARERDEGRDTPAEERVALDLWHWKDDYIQPMQKVRGGGEGTRSYRAVYHLRDRQYRQLADATMESVTPSQDGQCALGADDRAYRILVGYETNYADYYLVNTKSGDRQLILKKQPSAPNWSPGGKYALYYDGKDWNSIAVADGRITNLTQNLGVKFYREEHDQPSPAGPYGLAGWTADDRGVLLYDRYDLWDVAPDGTRGVNLTGGIGRQERIEFRNVRLDVEDRAIDVTKPLLLRAEDTTNRDTGFYRLRLESGSPPERLIMAAKSLGIPQKAKKADVMVLTASTFRDFPDLHVTHFDFGDLKRVSDANPAKDQLLWGSAELVPFKNADGLPLKGILVKPENFDPQKKYPMLVYIYERLSDNLHRFVNPAPGTSINVAYYASNGYLVLMPDIAYTVGYPGQSALKCVLPAIQAVVDKGCVDEKAIGIQGHSWGGYQIAYLITQTNRFRAVSAGAPVANMTSAYDGIRWGTGLPRQFQYERTQSRIGGTLWQYPMRFVENSPIFMADRVQTPLMMLHNDQDDAVPWYQGIEYYLALRRLGKEVYLFNYNGEGHGLRRRPNQKDYTLRMQQFFDHYLRGAAKPEWMAKGIPYVPRGPAGAEPGGEQ